MLSKKVLLLSLMAAWAAAAQAQNPQNQQQQRPQGMQQQQRPSNIPGTDTDNAPKGNAKVTGVVVDAETKQVVEFATVALINKATDKPIDGTTTNEKGVFTISKVAAGTYKVAVSFVGYQTKTIDEVSVPAKGEVNLGTIALPADVKMLKDVEVVDQKDLVEDKIDRIVYNAEKDATNAGGNAGDVLRKVPMLSVDLDGNVQLRGSSNVRVLINGKPSSIMAGSVADALRQIPADMIKNVEVITSPSAKYDAEGTSGIINIVTKKNTLQGLNGSVNASAGTRSSNLMANLNYRQGKMGVGLNGGGHMIYNWFDTENRRENILPSGGRTVLSQVSDGRNFGMFGNWQLNTDYEINKNNTLAFSFRFGQRDFRNTSDLNTLFNSEQQVQLQNFDRDITNRNRNYTYDFNLDYTHTFKKPRQEFAVLALYSMNDGGTKYNLDQTNNLLQGTTDYRERNDNTNFNGEFTLQADYTHPFSERLTLETGVKGILREVKSDFQFFNYDFERSDFVNIPQRSNVFDYDQNVFSSYASVSYNSKSKIGIVAGVRYEHTDIGGNFVTSGTTFEQNYNNVIPSIVISKDFKKGQKLKFSYNKRIQRPSIFFLNPFVNYADAKNISYGNPLLNPELTDNYEVSYNAFFGRSSFTAAVYLRETNNAIASVTTVNQEGVAATTYDNVAVNRNYGFSLFGSFQLTQRWRVGGNANIFYAEFNGPSYNANNQSWMYNINFNTSFNLNKGFSIQGFGFLNSPRVELQGRTGAFSFYTFGLRKEILNKKGGITFGVDNVFRSAMIMKSELSSPTFSSESVRNIYNRAIRVGFNYQFGKMNFTDKPKRKRINNDDAKQGGGDNN
jgi:outer membrane receptor protein involved in Fe transport